MGQAMTDRLSGLSTGNARGALLGAAALAVVAVALVLTVTGVAAGEVVATLLFLPVFAAGLLAGRTAGYGTAAVATAVYVLLRRGDLSGAGVANAGVLTLTRAGAYAVAGHVGALARTFVGAGDAASRRSGARRAAPARASRPRTVAWDEPWEAERSQARAHDDRTRPVLVGVGPSASGASFAGGEDGYGDGPMTTSGGWPPDPPHEQAPDEHVGARAGGWSDPGGRGWPDGAGGWPADTRPAADDDWEAVQSSWRRQNGLPAEDETANGALPRRHGGRHDDWGASRGVGGTRPVGSARSRAARPIRGARRRPTARVRGRIRGVRRRTGQVIRSVGHAAGPRRGSAVRSVGRAAGPRRGSAVRSVGHASERRRASIPTRGARRRPTAPGPRPTRGARPSGPRRRPRPIRGVARPTPPRPGRRRRRPRAPADRGAARALAPGANRAPASRAGCGTTRP